MDKVSRAAQGTRPARVEPTIFTKRVWADCEFSRINIMIAEMEEGGASDAFITHHINIEMNKIRDLRKNEKRNAR